YDRRWQRRLREDTGSVGHGRQRAFRTPPSFPPAPGGASGETFMAIRRCWYHLGMLCWSSLLLAGCDDTSASRPASTPSATPTSASPPAPIPAPQPEPKVSFASLDAGVAAFQEACEARDGEQITATMRWLADQGPAA